MPEPSKTPRPYERTRQIMRVVSEAMVEGSGERGFALQDAVRAAVETLEDELEVLGAKRAILERSCNQLQAQGEQLDAEAQRYADRANEAEAYAEECRRLLDRIADRAYMAKLYRYNDRIHTGNLEFAAEQVREFLEAHPPESEIGTTQGAVNRTTNSVESCGFPSAGDPARDAAVHMMESVMGIAPERSHAVGHPQGADDGGMAAMLLDMLRKQAWPFGADPRWQLVELWADQLVRLNRGHSQVSKQEADRG